MRFLSRPSSTTSSVIATYARAIIARAKVVSVTGLKKNLGNQHLAWIFDRETIRLLYACVNFLCEWLRLGVRLSAVSLAP